MHLRQRYPTAIRPKGKRASRSAHAGSLLALLPLVPDQETVRQHHTHRVPMKARPQPPLVLVPAQQTFGLLVMMLRDGCWGLRPTALRPWRPTPLTDSIVS